MTDEGRLLVAAEFDPAVKKYWLLSGTILCVVTIIGIPFIPFYLILGSLLTGKYLDAMECELTTRSLRVKKGLLNTLEKSIPLDKVTDLALYQGPIMRMMNIEGLKIETAGQSSAGGALVSLVGVKNARAFRDRVLTQRDDVTDSSGRYMPQPGAETSAPATASSDPTLVEIRDALLRIEERLKETGS